MDFCERRDYDESKIISKTDLRKMQDHQKKRKNGMYFLTGSQQFTLMEKATETLSGRIGIVQLYPLSAREIRRDAFFENFIPSKDYILERNKALSKTKYSVQDTWNRI